MEPEKTYHHGDLKAELIREGLKILDTEGYDSLSLRKVAKACNVSQTAPYRHFKNKVDLVGAITIEAMTAFDRCLAIATEKYPEDTRLQLKEMGVAYIRFFSENPEYMRLLFLGNIQEKVGQEAMDAFNKKYMDQLSQGHAYSTLNNTISRYKADYPEEKMTQEELVLLCWGLVHGISTLIVTGELPGDAKSFAKIEKMIWSNSFLG